MAHFLFIDESGHDRKASPYEVLAGIAIEDHALWNLIKAMHEAEIRHFGRRYSQGPSELKAKKLLNKSVFHHSNLNADVMPGEIPSLAKFALDDGSNATVRHLKALALAKIHYVQEIFLLCQRFQCKAFASIVETDARCTESDGLRKDYGYLLERFFYFLEDLKKNDQGIVVFDELEKSRSHILIEQVHGYFKDCATGKHRAGLIIPEPFFVHSDLTTGVQIADLVAYTISWGFRINKMKKPARPELKVLADQVSSLRYKTTRQRKNKDFDIWSFSHITDLRTRAEKEDFAA